MTLAVNIAQGGSNNVTMRNRIINGGMNVNQRATSINATTAWQYTVDRFAVYGSVGGKFTAAQSSTAPAGFYNSLLLTSSSAYSVVSSDEFLLKQPIEGYNVADLNWGSSNAKTVVLSFWVQSSLTGLFSGNLRNATNDRCYVFSYTITSANTWQQITLTIPGDTTGTWAKDNGVGISIWWTIGTGSTYLGTAGSWGTTAYDGATGTTSLVGTNGATLYITGVQLEAGTTASPFEYRQYGTELVLCQRYYEKTYNTDVVPGTNTAVGRLAPGSASDNGNNTSADWRFAVEKRASPTLTYYTTTGTVGSWNFERAGSSTTATVTTDSVGTRGGRSYLNCGATNVPVWIYGHAVATAEL